jgi:uncharacterized membrane protein
MQDDNNESKYWKWGIFYFNPENKRILVPKREPTFGVTLNFGNPYSIIFISLLLVVLMLVSYNMYLFYNSDIPTASNLGWSKSLVFGN